MIDDWMALAYDQGSFAVAEANGTLTDTFLQAVFEHPRTDFSQLEQLNLSSMPGARLTHLDFLQKTPNLQMLNLSLQEPHFYRRGPRLAKVATSRPRTLRFRGFHGCFGRLQRSRILGTHVLST